MLFFAWSVRSLKTTADGACVECCAAYADLLRNVHRCAGAPKGEALNVLVI